MWPDWRNAKRILDIGAYEGIAVKVLREQGFDAVGYDPDVNAASASEFVTSELSDIGSFDLLWFSHVLEHLPSALEELKSKKPLAKLAFVEIPPGNYQLPHVLVFDDNAFSRLVSMADMKVVVRDHGIRAVLEWQ
jgi:hypothetical protein